MTKKIIGIDFDDVLMDFIPGLLSFLSRKLGKTIVKEDIGVFYFWETFGVSKEEAIELCEEYYFTEEHSKSLPVVGSREAIEKLSAFSLQVITARPSFAEKVTTSWMLKHFKNNIDRFHFTNAFKSDQAVSKGVLAKELGISYFIDDAPHNALDVAAYGIPVFLFDAPWNKKMESHPLITRVTSWDEIVKHIMSLEKQVA
jgi:uncharacterized HAD superfamily protein